MKRKRFFAPLLGILIVGAMLPAGCVSTGLRNSESALKRLARRKPASELAPEEVVRIQVEALKYNDQKNRGIEIVYRFASPGNRNSTGPLSRFISMIYSEAYRPMLNHTNAEYGRIEVADEQAGQRVSITTEDGTRIVYVFVLSKQQGEECNGCWMTDAVFIESIQQLKQTA